MKKASPWRALLSILVTFFEDYLQGSILVEKMEP